MVSCSPTTQQSPPITTHHPQNKTHQTPKPLDEIQRHLNLTTVLFRHNSTVLPAGSPHGNALSQEITAILETQKGYSGGMMFHIQSMGLPSIETFLRRFLNAAYPADPALATTRRISSSSITNKQQTTEPKP